MIVCNCAGQKWRNKCGSIVKNTDCCNQFALIIFRKDRFMRSFSYALIMHILAACGE